MLEEQSGSTGCILAWVLRIQSTCPQKDQSGLTVTHISPRRLLVAMFQNHTAAFRELAVSI